MNNSEPIYLNDNYYEDKKYQRLTVIQITMADDTVIYVLPPVKDRVFFAGINWDKKDAELYSELKYAASLINSYVNNKSWTEWCQA